MHKSSRTQPRGQGRVCPGRPCPSIWTVPGRLLPRHDEDHGSQHQCRRCSTAHTPTGACRSFVASRSINCSDADVGRDRLPAEVLAWSGRAPVARKRSNELQSIAW